MRAGGSAFLSVARKRRMAAVAFAAALAGACASHPEYPLTTRSRPMSDLNPDKVGQAPPVLDAVTGDRLVRAGEEPHNWLTYYGTYDGRRYSPLDQIDVGNVRELRPAWVFQFEQLGVHATPLTAAFEAAPLVVDGVMYVSGPNGYVWALDAATGRLLWQFAYAVPIDAPLCCGNVNRGVAVARGRVFYASPNGHLFALDGVTGKPVWERVFADVRAGETATAAPLVVKNLVIVGSSGAEYGVRGHLDAYDLETGERVWRRYTVPRPGEPGSESWPTNRAWERGGGSTWITGTYDPELDLLYWGTANPAPVFNGLERPGDNLYTSSVLALDPDDGSIQWHYQWTPHDVWDYDGTGESILVNRGGRRLLLHFDRNGYYFVLDRETGEFVQAHRFARADWADIDPATGAVTNRKEPTPEGTRICPGPAGAKVWNHAAYSDATGLLYVPVIELCATFTASEQAFAEGMPYFGSAFANFDEEGWGHVKAFTPDGTEVWSWRSESPIVTSMLATGGGLVFTGDPLGRALALDARTGELLWQFRTGSGIHSNPTTYSVGGKQYVAIPSGWGGWVEGFAPQSYGSPRATALYVFALP
jgi:alcohol dehydrogenase (cytochrome c)